MTGKGADAARGSSNAPQGAGPWDVCLRRVLYHPLWTASNPGMRGQAMTPSLIVPPRRTAIETTDPEQAVALLGSANHTTIRSMLIAAGRPLRYSGADAGVFSVDDISLPLEYIFHSEPVGRVLISHRISGTGERHTHGASDRYGPGDLYIAAQPDQPYVGSNRSASAHDLQLVFLDPVLLTRIAATDPAPRPGPVRFTSLAPMSQAAAASWKAARSHVAELLADPSAAAEPLVLGNAARLLAAAALATFPNNALTDPAITDRRDASEATARRASAFIDEHAHDDICVADIAAFVHVSVRAVQLAFRRHLGTTPMAYLRRVRLDQAHRQLLTADPARDTVAAVAYRWGFASPGRFAAYYREAYGVLPGQTLGRQ